MNWFGLAIGLILMTNGAVNLVSTRRREANVRRMVDHGSPLFRALRIGPLTEANARTYTVALGSLMIALGMALVVVAALSF